MRKVLLLMLAMCHTAYVKAQDVDSIRTKELEAVVITSIRATGKSPVTNTTITRSEINKMYIGQDPSVVLEKLTPSIISYSDAGSAIGNYNQFRLRGIDQTRINVTLNGVPLNDMIDQGVFFSNFSDFANSVESIQVQRGVGTSTNGVASYGGSVNFESPRLNTMDPGFELQLLGGSFNTFRTSAEVSTGKMDNKIAVYSRLTMTASDGYKRNSGSDAYSLFFSGAYLGDRDILKITGFAGKTQNDQSYLPVLLSDIKTDPRTNYNHPNDTDDFEQELIQLQYSRILNRSWTANGTLYYGGARGVFPFGLSDTTQLLFGLKNDHFGAFGDLNYESDRLKINTGLHGYLFKRKNINSTAPNTSQPYYEDETEKKEFSVFSKAQYELGKIGLFADLQLRYVELNFVSPSLETLAGQSNAMRSFVFINPRVGINYNFNDYFSTYASFGRTGREPTRTDILQGDGSGIYDYNFQSAIDESIVSEEYVNDLEIGLQFGVANFNASINYFYMAFENEISLVGALAAQSYIQLRQNVPKSTRSGFEGMISMKFNQNVEGGITLSRLMTNVEEFVNASSDIFSDVEHVFAPDWIIAPYVEFSYRGLGLNLSGRYVSESYMELSNDPDFTLPDYFIANAMITYSILERVNVSLSVNNIFDELYFTDGSPVDLDFDGMVEGPGYRVQPPRNFFLSTSIKF